MTTFSSTSLETLPPLSTGAGTPTATPSRPGGTLGVLVVDDEPLIRELLARYLRLKGFRPYLAASGREAVDAYTSGSAGIDIVLMDVRMPGMDGPAALAALRRFDPRVRCCFMSGDLGVHTSEELAEMGVRHLFVKPLNLADLAEELQKVAECPAV